VGVRLRAIGQHMPEVGQLGVAIFLDELGDVLAPAPAAGLALDRERGDAEIREGVVGVVSHGFGPPRPHARRLAGGGGLTSGRGNGVRAELC
jgi:hypothetical protein